jgi:hypothetical protein
MPRGVSGRAGGLVSKWVFPEWYTVPFTPWYTLLDLRVHPTNPRY